LIYLFRFIISVIGFTVASFLYSQHQHQRRS